MVQCMNGEGACSLMRIPPERARMLQEGGRTDHDVAAAEELAADVDLREGGPRGVLLQAGAQRVVLQDVHAWCWGLGRQEGLGAQLGA